jgi:hypothetical protein
MHVKWDIDENTVVELEINRFGNNNKTINGVKSATELTLHRKSKITFDLAGGRKAEISIAPKFGGSPLIELRVDGQLMVPTEKKPVTCGTCGAVVRPNDRFCGTCGKALPPPEAYEHRKRLKEATTSIWILAALFTIFGMVMFFVTRDEAGKVLAKIAQVDDNATRIVGGVTYTAAQIREQLSWAPWNVLFVNLGLAAVMSVLAIWSRRSPLAAVLVAAATYAVVQVVNAIVDPASIAQGIILKVIVVLILARGIQSGLALRRANV